jgi:hypothetical protein
MTKNLPNLLLAVIVLFACNCFAQLAVPDSALHKQQMEFVNTISKNAVNEQSKIYNGIDYKYYNNTYKGMPYFKSNGAWTTGNITYNNVQYKNMQVMYDMFKDVLVVKSYNNFLQFSLYSTKVQGFDMFNHHFFYHNENAVNLQLKSGFYDLLYNDKTSLLAKREMLTQDSTGTDRVYKNFYPVDAYYIIYKGKSYKVKSRGDVTGVFKDKKKDVEKYIKDNRLNFSDDREYALTMAVKYYNQSSK